MARHFEIMSGAGIVAGLMAIAAGPPAPGVIRRRPSTTAIALALAAAGVMLLAFFLPSPLVGEGGSKEKLIEKQGEGFVSRIRDPSSNTDYVRATFSHKREGKMSFSFFILKNRLR